MEPRIIIVEADPIQAWSLASVLTDHRYHCVTAADPTEALSLCRNQLFDLALVNARFDRIPDGLRLAERLRRQHLLPSLLLAGRRRKEVLASPEYRGQPILSKPYTMRQCLQWLDKLKIVDATHQFAPA